MNAAVVTDEPAKKRILVIEDEPDIVRGIRDALEFEGFEVRQTGRASPRGLTVVRCRPPFLKIGSEAK